MSASPLLLLASAPYEPLLEGLTADQSLAVIHGRGPQVIHAGPGAGKTRTLITRIRYLLATGRALPLQIVLVTFTNQAARECIQRLERELGHDVVAEMQVCTFHALCSRILRTHAELVGRTPAFTIYDQSAVRGLIDFLVKDKTRKELQAELGDRVPPPSKDIAEEISLAKSRLWTPDFYARWSRNRRARLIAAIWREVDKELEQANALDFDDLLLLTVRLLGEHPDLQIHYRARWPWVLVDEVQDTCFAQFALLRLLGEPDGNLTICGDPDQALYSWRGAEPRNLLSFRSLFPSRRTVTLAVNFRSYEEIVRHAEAVIVNNANRPPIDFVADRGPGGHVRAKGFENEFQEAAWIASEIARQIRGGVRAENILVLARAAFASTPVRKALEKAGIAHHVLGSVGLFERSDVKDALAYVQLIQNPLDSIALRRAISHPRREAGPVTAAAVVTHARAQHIDLLEACARASEIKGLRKHGRENLERFGRAMLKVRDAHRAGAGVSETVKRTLTLDGGLVRHYQWLRDHPPKAESRVEAEAMLVLLRGMRESALRFEQQTPQGEQTLLGFVEHAAGLHSDGPAIVEEGVGVSTIHRAKGMEAPVVFICACEEEIAPSRHAIHSRSVLALEEERCAFYVAMSRAEDVLVMTWSTAPRSRRSFGRSRYLDEAGL
jgi:DNA helicase-2/ATP-dependent DNA helicase PcrA